MILCLQHLSHEVACDKCRDHSGDHSMHRADGVVITWGQS